MKFIIFLALLASPALFAKTEYRCGWIDNPTPGNYSIVDKDGAWIINTQGGYHADGDVNLPKDDNERVFLGDSPSYGFSCGCVLAETDASDPGFLKITRILKSVPVRLSRCVQDPALPKEYRPVTLVHSTGKAYTECRDESEYQVRIRGRNACLSQAGDYYFLAE